VADEGPSPFIVKFSFNSDTHTAAIHKQDIYALSKKDVIKCTRTVVIVMKKIIPQNEQLFNVSHLQYFSIGIPSEN
jgi:hypothetical protein